MKGLYLFQRYLPFAELVWVVLSCQSDMVSIFSCSKNFFLIGPMGEILRETGCRRVYYADGGS